MVTRRFPFYPSKELREAWEFRLEANLIQRCPACENTIVANTPAEDSPNAEWIAALRDKGTAVSHGTLAHEDYCPVSDANMARLIKDCTS